MIVRHTVGLCTALLPAAQQTLIANCSQSSRLRQSAESRAAISVRRQRGFWLAVRLQAEVTGERGFPEGSSLLVVKHIKIYICTKHSISSPLTWALRCRAGPSARHGFWTIDICRCFGQFSNEGKAPFKAKEEQAS